MLKESLKQFMRSRICMAAVLLLLLWQFWCSFKDITVLAAESMVNNYFVLIQLRWILETCKVSFVVYLFVSYIYFSMESGCRGTIEVIRGEKSGIEKVLCGKLLTVLMINALHLMILLCMCMVSVFMFRVFFIEYIWELIKTLVLYFYLYNLFGILLGMGLAYIKSSYLSFTLLVVFVFLFATNFSGIYIKSQALTDRNVLYQIGETMQIYPRSINIVPQYMYPAALEGVNWQKTIFWILLALLTAVFIIFRSKKRLLSLVILCLLCIDLSVYVKPASTFYAAEFADNVDSWDIPVNYYFNKGNGWVYEELREVPYESFRVEKYYLKADCGRILSVCAEIYPDRKLAQYVFTFSHEYKITGLTDGTGKVLNYERLTDYLIINDDVNGGIFLEYEGKSERFQVNTNIIDLPPYFAWYPQPGIHQVYDISNFQYTCDVLEGSSEFCVEVNTGGLVYSNLETVEKNVFAGNSQGCLLLKGLCIGETEVDGCRIIYPKLYYPKEAEVQKAYREITEMNGQTEEKTENKDWFIMPTFGSREECFFMKECFGGDEEMLKLYLDR